MKKTNKNRVKEFIRVDHAGERGAIKIYEGQLLALNTFIKDDDLKKKIEQMKVHEKEHCDYFENEIRKRNIQPTKFLPLWDILGVGLGFGTAILGKKAAMLCTASVEEVIDEHYSSQIYELESDEKELKKKKGKNASEFQKFILKKLKQEKDKKKIVLKLTFMVLRHCLFVIQGGSTPTSMSLKYRLHQDVFRI